MDSSSAIEANTPHVPDERKMVVENPGYGCYAVTVKLGFMEIPNIPVILQLVAIRIPAWQYGPADTSFFLARDTVIAPGESGAMLSWREKLFAFPGRNAAQAAEYYSPPANRVVEMDGQINL